MIKTNFTFYYQELKYKSYYFFLFLITFSGIFYYYQDAYFYTITKLLLNIQTIQNIPKYFITTNLNEIFFIFFQMYLLLFFFISLILISLHFLYYIKPGCFKFEYTKLYFVFWFFWGGFCLIMFIYLTYVFPIYYNLIIFYNNFFLPENILIYYEPTLLNYISFFFNFVKLTSYFTLFFISLFLGILIFQVSSKRTRKLLQYSLILIFLFFFPDLTIVPLLILTQIFFEVFLLSVICFKYFYQLFFTKPEINP